MLSAVDPFNFVNKLCEACQTVSLIIVQSIYLFIRCTAVVDTEAECKRTAQHFTILPPVVSCKIKTKQTFTFKYGRVEIRAKLPKGDWMFPRK